MSGFPFEFNPGMSTGDKDAIHKNLLEQIVKYLVKQFGYRNIKAVKDLVGVYSYVLKDYYGKSFYLIAKGGFLWKGIVSCQPMLPKWANEEHRPIILGWLNSEDPKKELKFHLFDPANILAENEGVDNRKGVNMLNFLLKQSVFFDPSMSVEAIWEKMRKNIGGSQQKLG